jgi:Tfp pilus assembly protein PilF
MDFETVVRDLLNPSSWKGEASHALHKVTRRGLADSRNGAPGQASSPGPRRVVPPEKLFEAGMKLLERQQPREAALAFEKALAVEPENPDYLSWCGLALALARTRGSEAIRMCEQAVEGACMNPNRYLNLGRTYLMSGQRSRAWQAFQEGLRLDASHAETLAAIAAMGQRRKPVFPFLPRGHRANRLAGRALARMGGA